MFPDGLFEGRLAALLIQKRHAERSMELMYEEARKPDPDREHLSKIVDEAMNSYSNHRKDCAEFIAMFGEYLALKPDAECPGK